MKSPKASVNDTPLANLKELLKQKNIQLAPNRPNAGKPSKNKPANNTEKNRSPAAERELFLDAMSDVIPIEKKNCRQPRYHPPRKRSSRSNKSDGTLNKLQDLIESGQGFVIAQTSEYIEGANARTHPELTRLLHGGHFSIQDHIDLHGLNVETAQMVFDNFMKNAVATGKKGILIVHGRGLSSPVEPVLKNRVFKWLSSGSWRKWVVAFATARACDGGAGATYVLLRDHPAKKRQRKNIS